jgi:hypothetical protein
VELPPAADTPTPQRQTYELRYRPAVGQRWAYEQSTDSTLSITRSTGQQNVSSTRREVRHSQVIVTSDEILEANGAQVTAKRVTFGKGCFSFDKIDDEPRRDQRMIYSDKTVTFRVLPDGTLDHDFGVKANGRHMRLLRDTVMGRTTILPDYLVGIGDRWHADDAIREVMQVDPGATVSLIGTLKAVREQNGRRVADISVTAAVLATERGLNLETGIEGTYVIDVETGVPIKVDLVGQITVAGHGPRGGTASGSGTFEFHRAARPLPPASQPDPAG